MARIRFEPTVREQWESLPGRIAQRMTVVLDRLRRWPNVSGAKPLRGSLAGHYRMRSGDYRLQFHVQGDDIVIERVGHRDEFYEE